MITSIDPKKCTGCGTCVKNCVLDVFALNTAQGRQAPCMPACPCGVNIRSMIYLLQQDKNEEALQLLKEAVPFPAITCRLCAHPCENSCLRKPLEESVNILGLERYLSDIDLELEETRPEVRHLAKVAVIGGGLAGLSCACFLSKMGYAVTVFEAGPEPGGTVNSLPEQVLPQALLRKQWDKVGRLGIELRLNCKIGPKGDLDWPELLARGFKAACLATGDPTDGSQPMGLSRMGNDGYIKADAVTLQTDDRHIFAAGAIAGAKSVEAAIGQARHAAHSIARYLQGEDFLIGRWGGQPVAENLPSALPTYKGFKNRRGGNLNAWEQEFVLEEAQLEALRCLTCGSKAFLAHTDDCMTCFTCEMGCPSKAITVHPFKEVLPRTLELLD